VRVKPLVVGEVQRVAVVLADEVVVGVRREVRVDADGVVAGDGEPALVEGSVVIFAEAEAVSEVVGAAFALGVDVGGVHNGRAVAGTKGSYATDRASVVVELANPNTERFRSGSS
jgi:hypothetical protein